jgi:DNA anti-recombination protein RmuC
MHRKTYEVDGGWALILSAVVTTVGGVLVALIAQFRKENKEDHAVVAGMLSHIYRSVGRVETKVDKVENKLNDHIKEHTRS